MPIDFFKPSGKSSIETYLPHLSNCKNLILVHNTFSGVEDIIYANKSHKELYWCLCPKANVYIENTLPLLSNFITANCKMIIGTDSLASNTSLSVSAELNTILCNFNWLKLTDVLKWATFNGAEALGIQDNFGGFIRGRNAGINHLNYKLGQVVFERKVA